MAIMPDHWIREQAEKNNMISPFVEGQKKDGVISYGLSSYGYDCRVSDEFIQRPLTKPVLWNVKQMSALSLQTVLLLPAQLKHLKFHVMFWLFALVKAPMPVVV